MMHEDLIKEIEEEKKTGLELSDTAYYNVDDGVTDEPLTGDEEHEISASANGKNGKPAKDKSGKGGKGLAVFWFLAGIFFCAFVLVMCTSVFRIGRFVRGEEYNYYTGLDDSYGKYYEIMEMICEDPLAERTPEELSDTTLKTLVSETGDPYGEYYTAKEYESVQRRYEGNFVGVGISIADEDGKFVIKTVFEDSPAEEAGIMPEDMILKVDGEEITSVDDAVDHITGEIGTKVVITLQRGDEVFDVEATRQQIETESVAYDVLEGRPEIGYIVISSFAKETDDDFKMAVKDLKSQGCTKFIVDLRDNGGGLTDSSIEIADYLLPSCNIMSEKTKAGKETVYNSDEVSADLDMVILVNENTASASEILTAALQDNNAATVIGTKTYGKGVTQLMHRFGDGSAVKLTVTEYFRPSGKTVHGVGITPDIEAEGDEVFEKAFEELEE